MKFLANHGGAVSRVLAATAAMTAVSGQAHAGSGVGGVAGVFNQGLDSMGKTVIGVSMLGGLGLVGAGLLKLKAASDSAGREPYGPGIWRLGAGAGLVGLTTMTGIFTDTATGGAPTSALAVGTAKF